MSLTTSHPPPSEPPVPPGPAPGHRRPDQRRFPEGFTLAVAAVMGALIVLAGLLLWQLRQDDPTETVAGSTTASSGPGPASSSSTTPTTGPSTTGAPTTTRTTPSFTLPGGLAPVACPAGTDPVICDAAAFVQQVRQRPFQVFPTVELLADAEFDEALLSDFEDYRADLDADGVTLTALGLLDPDVSLSEAYRDALELGVVGFYDPTTGQLVVRGGELDLYAQEVLVHELTHALDDQWFDLDRDDFVDGEAEYGFTAVVEGNAKRVEDRWRAQLDADRQAQLAEDELGALAPEDMVRYFSLPPILQQLQLSPYTDGEVYVDHLIDVGSEAAVEAALTDPPTTSEEILHPEPDAAEPPEIEVPAPDAGGEVVDQGRLGEMLMTQWLGATAARGWGGDRYVAWRDGDRSCIAIDLAADTPEDLAQMETAVRTWVADASDDRTVTTATVAGVDVVRATGCAG